MKASDKAYDVLYAAIIDGEFPPGARITEGLVVDRAGVSRTPVREAVRRLEAEGLLRFVPNQGAFVTAWSDEEVEDIFELRALLEGHAARLAATRGTEDQFAELRKLAVAQLAESEQKAGPRLDRVSSLNARFHQQVIEAANSPRLAATLAGIANAPLVLQTFRDYRQDELVRSAAHHLELVDALEARDPAWADSVMRSHVMAARRVFLARRDSGNGD